MPMPMPMPPVRWEAGRLFAPAETSNEFWIEFNKLVSAAKEAVASAPAPAPAVGSDELGEKGEALAAPMDVAAAVQLITLLKAAVIELQAYATISTITLAAFDIRRSQEIIAELNKQVVGLTNRLQPKKKFSFTCRERAAARAQAKGAATAAASAAASTATAAGTGAGGAGTSTTSSTEVGAASTAPAPSSSGASLLPPGAYVLSNKDGESIALDAATLRQLMHKDAHNSTEADLHPQIFINNTTNCTIHLPSLLGSVRIEHISDCTIYLGPVCTSVYLESVTNCKIYIASHQLRIHQCAGCRLYVRCNSHPIVEDCVDMGFAPYTYKYGAILRDFELAGLSAAKCWDNVVDFRWHKTTASPHWHVIPQDRREE